MLRAGVPPIGTQQRADLSTPDLKNTLGDHGVDVWLIFYDEIDEAALGGLRALLSVAEREQQTRFHLADDRKRYLATRAAVRCVLSRYAPVAPAEWAFASNRYGRPQIADRHAEASILSFNVSHARGLIALGIAWRRALGVDVEQVSMQQASLLEIAQRFFAPAEVAELARVPPERLRQCFFEYWTFKESYIKARGMGLSLPLEQFSFHYPDEDTVRLAIDPRLGDDPDLWHFWQYRPTPQHLLAVCAGRGDGILPRVRLRKLMLPGADSLLEIPLLKASARATC